MKHLSRLPLLLLAALVMALSYLGGALAPPLHGANPDGPSTVELTAPQWETLQTAMDLLLGEDDLDYDTFLPSVSR